MGLLDTIGDFFQPTGKNTAPLDAPIQNYRIMGLPLHYTALTDPTGRVFAKTILSDIPLVTFMPGRPQFLDIKSDAQYVSEDSFVQAVASGRGIKEGDETAILKYLQGNTKGDTDLRYYGFRPDYSNYFDYVQVMLSSIHVKMGLGGIYNFGQDYRAKWGEAGLTYFADRSTAISESADNTFEASKLDSFAKTASGLMRELQFLMGTGKASQTELDQMKNDGNSSKIQDTIDSVKSGDLAKELIESNRGGIDKLKTVLNGSQLLFPNIWQDSQFSKSYSVSFRFYSPYGDPLSIFHNVYVPFISLLCLTLPKQDTLVGYYSPFVVRVDAPGWFTVDLGVITSMSIKRGGAEELFSKDGLPLAIDVTLNIKDMYPALMMAKSYSVLATNIGLAGYLDNMAGVQVTDLKVDENIEAWLKSKINHITGLPYKTEAYLNTQYTRLIQRVNDFFNPKW